MGLGKAGVVKRMDEPQRGEVKTGVGVSTGKTLVPQSGVGRGKGLDRGQDRYTQVGVSGAYRLLMGYMSRG